MRNWLYTYKITHDSGFAPNPFHNVLTLATCKPGMRRTKQKGDWIAGFSSKCLSDIALSNGVSISPDALIYLAQVSDVLDISEYYLADRFNNKIPKGSDDPGDNIYKPLCEIPINKDDFEQLNNVGDHGECDKKHDLGGKKVLIFDEYYYLGRNGIPIPPDLKISRPKGPTCYGYKTDDAVEIKALVDWVRSHFKRGINGMPCLIRNSVEADMNCGGCG